MPSSAEIKLVERTCRQWVARPVDVPRWMREIQLISCPAEEPSQCILRNPRELAWGRNPEEAIRSLLHGVDPGDWPERVVARPFDFSGPAIVVNDPDVEASLLSADELSPLWEEIRKSASERRVGLIQLAQLSRAIVPIWALKSSGAQLGADPNCRESTFNPGLAFSEN